MTDSKYQKLKLKSPISEELEAAIDVFINYINNSDGQSEDCYRSEIEFWLKDAKSTMSQEQYDAVKKYYVLGGIYGSIKFSCIEKSNV